MNWTSPLHVTAVVISLTSAFLLFLVLPPYLLPTPLSGIAQSQRPRPSSISLVICTILFAGHIAAAGLTGRVTLADGTTVCAVDAILQTFLLTTVFAHLPLVASVTLALRPTRHEDHRHPSGLLWSAVVSSPYVYAILPNIPLLTMLASGNFSFAVWWEFHCIERDAWWRIVHGVSLVLPPIVTLVLCIMIADVLGSCSGDPSPVVGVKRMEWFELVFLILCSLGAVAYLIAEQVIGWSASWTPRIAEAAISPLVLMAFIIDPYIWRAYSHWVRGRRPPEQADDLDLFDPATGTARLASPADWLNNKSEKRTRSFHSSQSSFYIPPPAPSWRPFSRKVSLPRTRSRGTEGRTRSPSKRSRNQMDRNLSTRSGPLSPPFTYSVARSDTSPTFDEPMDVKSIVPPPSPSYYLPPRPPQPPGPAVTRPYQMNQPHDTSPEVRQWRSPPSPSYYVPRPSSPRTLNGLSRPTELRKQLVANLHNTKTQYTEASILLDNPFSPVPSENVLAYLSDEPKAGASDLSTNVSGPSRWSKESLDDRTRFETRTKPRQPIQSMSGSVMFVGANAGIVS